MSPSMSHWRIVFAFIMVSAVVNVFEITTTSVVSGLRPRQMGKRGLKGRNEKRSTVDSPGDVNGVDVGEEMQPPAFSCKR